MKQGRASRDVLEGWKPKTNPHAADIRGVSQIGQSIGNHVTEKSKILKGTSKPMYAGRGFESPLGAPGTAGVGAGGRTIYKPGLQGRR